MIKLRLKLSVLLTLLFCLMIPSFVSAQSTYDCGTYGSGSYGSNCQSTSTSSGTSGDTSDSENDSTVITANGTELTTDTTQTAPEFSEGTPIEFSGSTYPNAEVHLYFQSDPFEAVVTADANGDWSYTLAHDLGPGEHTLRIAVIKPSETTLGEKSDAFAFVITPASNSGTTNNDNKKSTNPDYTWYYVGGGILLLAVIAFVIWKFGKKNNKSQQPPASPYFN